MRIRTFVPIDHQRIEALLGRPHVIADHGDEIVEHHDLLHALDFFGSAVVNLRDPAAKHRTGLQRCELHVGQYRIDAVDGLAVDFVRGIEPLQRPADQHEILRVLQRDILWRHLAARRERQRTIGKLAPAVLVQDLAVGGSAAYRLDLPLFRGGLDQHGARACAGSAQVGPPRPDRIGIAGGLNAKQRIAVELVAGRCVLQRHSREIGVELFRQNHRYRGVDALSHLDLRHHQRCRAGWIDADEGVRRKLAGGVVRRLHGLVDGQRSRRKMERKQKPARQASSQQRAA